MAEQLQFPELVDIKGAAEYLSTLIRHIRRLAQKGELAFVKIGGLIRFDKVDLQRYIDDNRHPSTTHGPTRPRGRRAGSPGLSAR